MGSSSSKVIDIIWFDENKNLEENKKFLKEIVWFILAKLMTI